MKKMFLDTCKNFFDTCKKMEKVIITFFKPVGINDDLLNLPDDLNKMGIELGIFDFILTLITLIFSYMLRMTNLLIKQRMILLGLILFFLYKGQSVLKMALQNLRREKNDEYKNSFDNGEIHRGCTFIGKVTDKVQKYDEKQKVYKLLNSEEIMNSAKSYIDAYWTIKNEHRFQILKLAETILMLIVAICTNTEINSTLFVTNIVAFAFMSFFLNAYTSINRKKYNDSQKEVDNIRDTMSNDLMRVPLIINKDLDMRLNKLEKANIESRTNTKKFSKKRSKSSIIDALIQVLSRYSIMLIYLFSINWENIDLATITQITALLAIVDNAFGNITDILRIFEKHQEKCDIIEREENDMMLILEAYHKEMDKHSKPIDKAILKPFEVSYFEESENDKPFTLVSNQQIEVSKGQIGILYGPSGSGKSTFMKLLIGRISMKKSKELPSTSRFFFYDEKLKFGSLSLYEEIFCSCETPDLDKMESIMRELHLWQELERNCHDVWTWLKEKHQNSIGPLSNGQNQRLILAKMLYWMDEDVDGLVLDECTSGLDATGGGEESADAQRILEYIVKYANRDKKRICIISTHQNIDSFIENVEDEFDILPLYFSREGDRNMITM